MSLTVDSLGNQSYYYASESYSTLTEQICRNIKSRNFDTAIELLHQIPDGTYVDWSSTVERQKTLEEACKIPESPIELIALLLDKGVLTSAEIDTPEPIAIAAKVGREDVVKLFLDRNLYDYRSAGDALCSAINAKKLKVIKTILVNNKELHFHLGSSIFRKIKVAITENEVEIVTKVFKHWHLSYFCESALPNIFEEIMKKLSEAQISEDNQQKILKLALDSFVLPIKNETIEKIIEVSATSSLSKQVHVYFDSILRPKLIKSI